MLENVPMALSPGVEQCLMPETSTDNAILHLSNAAFADADNAAVSLPPSPIRPKFGDGIHRGNQRGSMCSTTSVVNPITGEALSPKKMGYCHTLNAYYRPDSEKTASQEHITNDNQENNSSSELLCDNIRGFRILKYYLKATSNNSYSAFWEDKKSHPELMDKSLQLLIINQKDTKFSFEIHPDAILWFSKYSHKKIYVISICGMHSAGKSFLGNTLASLFSHHASTQSNFPFQLGINLAANSCQKQEENSFNQRIPFNTTREGVWMWACWHPNKTAIYLFIDFEGAGKNSRSVEFDQQLFTLAYLLSTVILYNSKGIIDVGGIDALATMCKLSQLKTKFQKQTSNLLLGNPCFFWVLRDFDFYILYENDLSIDFNSYMDNILTNPYKKFSKSGKTEDFLLQCCKRITTFFPERCCYPLVTPFGNENFSKESAANYSSKSNPYFDKQIAALAKKLQILSLQQEQKKMIMSCNIFSEMLVIFVDLINKQNEDINVDSLWVDMQAKACQRTKIKCEMFFRKKLVPLQPEIPNANSNALNQFKVKAKELRNSILNTYSTEFIGDENTKTLYKERLKKSMKRDFKSAYEQQKLLFRNHYQELLCHIIDDVKKTNLECYKAQDRSYFSSCVSSSYIKNACGPKKLIDKVLTDYYQQLWSKDEQMTLEPVHAQSQEQTEKNWETSDSTTSHKSESNPTQNAPSTRNNNIEERTSSLNSFPPRKKKEEGNLDPNERTTRASQTMLWSKPFKFVISNVSQRFSCLSTSSTID
ncbi:hypothetical protein IE077_003676 [Cardiosporidium cionae]|uniref:Guanylate-binding protein N-terminal domain-containing protein n=1 Tax=Cardiosporidium cionae TaxID=476202 RepID=A0ABQ7J7S4_9APIC|nr:hypothetical protein IE077_003676 [Cardiosporidium cionae]|eukprot:KAF8820021.1 hypothetical protein IE077_003676 [Cardiosporidium cionae]